MRHRLRGAGFTLIEMTIALGIFGILGYALITASEMGNNSYRAVAASTAVGRDMRSARSTIAQEFRTTKLSSVDIFVLPDGNHQVTFQQPLVVSGALTWGVHDASWGTTELEQNQVGWQVRYTVVNAVVNGANERQLVRQVLNNVAQIQEQDVIVRGLRAGVLDPPGFGIVQVGDLWQIEVTTEGHNAATEGRGVNFNVRMHN